MSLRLQYLVRHHEMVHRGDPGVRQSHPERVVDGLPYPLHGLAMTGGCVAGSQ